MKKVLLVSIISTSLVASTFAPVFADTQTTTTAQTTQVQTTATTITTTGSAIKVEDEENGVIDVVKNIDPQIVAKLRGLGFGYGKIALIVSLANKSGKTVDEVTALVKTEKGIGKIALKLKLKPSVVMAEQNKAEEAEKTEKVKPASNSVKPPVVTQTTTSAAITVNPTTSAAVSVKGEAERAVVQKLIDSKAVTVEKVNELRAKKLGYGQIALIVNLAQKANISVDDLLKKATEQKIFVTVGKKGSERMIIKGIGKLDKMLNLKKGDSTKAQAQINRNVTTTQKQLVEKNKKVEDEKAPKAETKKVK